MPQMTVPFIRRSALEPTDPLVLAPPSSKMLSDKTTSSIDAVTSTIPAGKKPASADVFDSSDLVMSSVSISSEKPLFFLEGVDVAFIALSIWLGVAITWLAFQLIKQNKFMKAMKAEATKSPHGLEKPISEAMALVGLKKRPDIRLSHRVNGPMVTGLVSPLILLPLDFEARFKPAQQSFAIVHEMAHIKRGDLWAALITLIFRAIFWPNPLVHYAAHKMRVDQEAACDASVIAKTGGASAAHSYAETLIHAAKSAGRPKFKAPLGLALSDTLNNQERDDDEMA